MIYSPKRAFSYRHYAKLVLVLFVLSVINMAIQVPAHAAMQQSMKVTEQMSMQQMTDMQMQECDCPPVMCETVASLDDQSSENLFSSGFNHLLGFYPVYSSHLADKHHASVVRLNRHEQESREFSPLPLSLKTVLHI